MFRRLFWFFSGVIAGATGVLWVKKKAGEIAQQLTPAAIFETLLDIAKALFEKVMDKVNGVEDLSPLTSATPHTTSSSTTSTSSNGPTA